MSNVFEKISKRFNSSNSLLMFAVALFSYGLYLGIRFFIEDFSANLAVYQTIPTRKVIEDMTFSMASFLQIAPLLFGFAFLRDTSRSNGGYLAMSMFFLFVDWGTGVYYRGGGFEIGSGWFWYAVVEDFVFFTVGSEVLIMLCAGTLWTMFTSLFLPSLKKSIFSENKPTLQNNMQNVLQQKGGLFSKKQKIMINPGANLPNERTNERTNEQLKHKKDQIILYAKHHKNKHGSYPSTKVIEELFQTSRGNASDILKSAFEDYGM